MASVNQRALPTAVPAIRAALSNFLDGVDVLPAQLADIQLAVTEAVANVVRHAYPDEPGQIRCDAVADNGTITITVSDWGCPFTAPTTDPGLGLGMLIMHSLAAQVTVRQVDGAKRVELTFAHGV
jgi:serine/threonine-protein kinase RsbW